MSDMYNKEQKDTHTHKKIMTINSEIKIQYNTHKVYINKKSLSLQRRQVLENSYKGIISNNDQEQE